MTCGVAAQIHGKQALQCQKPVQLSGNQEEQRANEEELLKFSIGKWSTSQKSQCENP